MRAWIQAQLDHVGDLAHPILVVLDRDGTLTEADFKRLGDRATIETADDWLSLRRVWELHGRHHDAGSGQLIVVAIGSGFSSARSIPFDIEQASTVIRLRIPVVPDVRRLVLELDPRAQDGALAAAEANGVDPVGAVIKRVWGVDLLTGMQTPGSEVAAVAQLMMNNDVSDTAWEAVRRRLRSSIASRLADSPPDPSLLQDAWAEWASSEPSSHASDLFDAHGPMLMPLFHAGLFTPVAAHRELPSWAQAGTIDTSPRDRAEALLSECPVESMPSSAGEWMMLATWWGEVRAALASGAPATDDLFGPAWDLWAKYDGAFRSFLHDQFGQLFSSAQPRPILVNRINSFLARRMADGRADRILLVVFDGMGMAQWSMLRSDVELSVVDPGAVFAMAPSLTQISRQAIFAGAPPREFADTLSHTKAEERRWRAFWTNEGLPVTAIGYNNVRGSGKDPMPELSGKKAFGIVVRAFDQLMHGSKLDGEVQYAASAQDWIQRGYVRNLIEHAASQGFEIWFTADHGGIEVVPEGRKMEGLRVSTAGTRVFMYENAALRAQSDANGDSWDPPGMPDDGPYCLFPWGRGAFVRDERVTHGGLSFDEMIVPFVQVKP